MRGPELIIIIKNKWYNLIMDSVFGLNIDQNVIQSKNKVNSISIAEGITNESYLQTKRRGQVGMQASD
jgi:hypothetical protein